MADEGMTLVVVTHDIPFARAVADRIVVLCEGAVVEEGAADDIMERPHHSVTRALLRHSTHDGDGQMTTGE
jgi:polar amino acid transport system ATP-binding protein